MWNESPGREVVRREGEGRGVVSGCCIVRAGGAQSGGALGARVV